jgi:clan AA aspartic protease
MITGTVTARREARILITVFAQDQGQRQVEAVIDTGFNGYLTLPGSVLRELRLRSVGARAVTLGDGSTAVLDLYRARLLWHDRERNVLVLQADGDPLLGMALLDGSRMSVDVVVDGIVRIEPLT